MANYSFQNLGISKDNTPQNKNYDSPNFVKFGYLEDNIENNTNNSKFKVLSVTGRELIPKTILKHDFETVNGQFYLGYKYEPRILEFTYLIDAKSSKEFIEIYNKLNYLLGQPELEFKFGDENMYYVGSLSEVGSIDTGKLKQLTTFSIECSDPFKYSTPKTASSVNTLNSSDVADTFKSTEISKVSLKVNSHVDGKLTLSIDDFYNINIKRIKTGDIVELDFINKVIRLNGVVDYNILSFNSDFENVVMHKHSVLKCSGCNISITYTHRSL